MKLISTQRRWILSRLMMRLIPSLRNTSSIRRMSWYTVLPRRFTLNGWSTRLKKNRVGVWLRVVSNTISTGRAISISPSMRRLTGHPSCAPTDSIAMRRL